MANCELCSKRKNLYKDAEKIKAKNTKNERKGIFTHWTAKQKIDVNNILIKKGEKNLVPIGSNKVNPIMYIPPFNFVFLMKMDKKIQPDKKMAKEQKLAEKGAKKGCPDCALRAAEMNAGGGYLIEPKKAQKFLEMAKGTDAKNHKDFVKVSELVQNAEKLKKEFKSQSSAYSKAKVKKMFAVASAATYGALVGGAEGAALAGAAVATGASASDVILGMDSGSTSTTKESMGTVKLEKRTAGEFYYFYPKDEPGSSGIQLSRFDPVSGRGETINGDKVEVKI